MKIFPYYTVTIYIMSSINRRVVLVVLPWLFPKKTLNMDTVANVNNRSRNNTRCTFTAQFSLLTYFNQDYRH